MNKHLFICVLMLAVIGCSTPTKGPTSIANVGVCVRSDLRIIVPTNEEHITWEAMLKKIDNVDVVLLGELHDHAVGHAVQFGIVEDVMKKYPGSVLALEMLERDEQLLVDDYMDGLIDADKLALKTQSASWAGSGSWDAWYQPIIDVVKAFCQGLDHGKTGTYNVASGQKTTINELSKLMIKISGKELSIIHSEETEGEIKHSLADISKIQQKLNFSSKISLKEGLNNMIFSKNKLNV